MRPPKSTVDKLAGLHKSSHSVGAERSVAERVRGRTGRNTSWNTRSPDRRRAGPPAFRRQWSPTCFAAPSFLVAASFWGILGLLGAGRGPLRPSSQVLVLNSQNPKYGLVLENEPDDFVQTFWGATYSEMIRKRRRRLFSGLPVCGDIPPFWPVI